MSENKKNNVNKSNNKKEKVEEIKKENKNNSTKTKQSNDKKEVKTNNKTDNNKNVNKSNNSKKNNSTNYKKNDSSKKSVNVNNKNKEVKEEVKKSEIKNKEVKDEEKTEAKKVKKVKTVSDGTVIGIIVAIIILAAGALFGIYYYNSNCIAVATFDGGKVTNSEFTIYYQTFSPMLTYYGYPESYIPEVIANKAAVDKILLAKAKDENITLTDDEKKAIDDEFTEDQIKYLEEQGINVSKTKQLYYNDKLISKYMEKMANDLTDDEVLEYIKSVSGENADLKSYNTSHILFKTVDSSYAALSDEEIAKQKKKAEEVLARALKGEDFSALVKEFSEDTGTKEDNGNYTVYMDGNTDAEYTKAATSLQVGAITPQLIKSSYGYHIIKLNSIDEKGRLKNSTDREALVDQKINKLATEKNYKSIEDKLKKTVEQITGKSLSDSTNTNSTDNTNSTTTTTDSTSTTTTDTTNTAQ